MKASKLLAVFLAAAAFKSDAPVRAQSTVIFDSLSLSPFGAHIVGIPVGMEDDWVMAQSFRTGEEDWTLESVTLSLALFEETPRNGGFTVSLHDDAGTGVGTQLLMLAGNDDPDRGLSTYTGSFDLSGNTTYWIQVETVSTFPSAYAGDITSFPVTVGSTSTIGMGRSPDGGVTWLYFSGQHLLMQVAANPTVVPEPSTLLLAAFGSDWLIFRRHRYSRPA